CAGPRSGRRLVREFGIRDGLILDSRFSGRRHHGRRGGGRLRRRTRRFGGLLPAHGRRGDGRLRRRTRRLGGLLPTHGRRGGRRLGRWTRRFGGLFLAQPIALGLFECVEEEAHDPHHRVTQRTAPPTAATSAAGAAWSADGYPNDDVAPAPAAPPAPATP